MFFEVTLRCAIPQIDNKLRTIMLVVYLFTTTLVLCSPFEWLTAAGGLKLLLLTGEWGSERDKIVALKFVKVCVHF